MTKSNNGYINSKGGYGIVITDNNNHYIDCYRVSHLDTTNNREELLSILHILKLAYTNQDKIYNIYSDSAYAINCFSVWSKTWSQKNWTKADNKPILNLNIIQEGYNILQQIHNVIFYHIKGHNNILFNEMADSLAANNIKKYMTLCTKNNIPIKEDLSWD